VLLRHDLPDCTHHFDWLIAQDADAHLPVSTFRCDRRVDELQAGESLEVLRLPDHRAVYLEYEGPVSGNRGSVQRLRAGEATNHGETSDAAPHCPLEIAVRWHNQHGSDAQRLSLTHRAGDNWIVTCVQRGG